MTGFHEKDGILYADELPLPEIALRYGTPSYVYSASHIRESVTRLQTAFRKALPAGNQPLIAFACKANSNIAVLRLMAGLGLGADIVSGGELARARRGGIPAEKIVFSGVGKTDDEIAAALDAGILQINVESRPELERIAALAETTGKVAPVTLRLNPGVDAETHAKISTGRTEDKFGMPRAEAEDLYVWANAHPHLRPRGFSLHIGSQLTSLSPFGEAFEILAETAAAIKGRSLPLESLDLGGGLGVRYRAEAQPDLDAYAQIVRETIQPLGTQIILEPGRLLVGEAGVLLCRVIFAKQGAERKYLILDAGMNDLMRPALYDAWHDVRPVDNRHSRPHFNYDVVGPVCETGDTFATARELPEMQAGDLAVLMTAGAYGFAMASRYNTRPLPAELLVDGDKCAIIRPRETINDIIDEEAVPGWL